MNKDSALKLLKELLGEILLSTGAAATERFSSLRDVDAKVREAKHIFQAVEGLPASFLADMSSDSDFDAQSRRVRLEALGNYTKSAIKFLESGALAKNQKLIYPAPDVSRITATFPQLKDSIDRRWKEAQKCIHVECFTSAVIMMGSILEALLLARANLSVFQHNRPEAVFQGTTNWYCASPVTGTRRRKLTQLIQVLSAHHSVAHTSLPRAVMVQLAGPANRTNVPTHCNN